MKKRIPAALLALVMLLACLAGCGKKVDPKDAVTRALDAAQAKDVKLTEEFKKFPAYAAMLEPTENGETSFDFSLQGLTGDDIAAYGQLLSGLALRGTLRSDDKAADLAFSANLGDTALADLYAYFAEDCIGGNVPMITGEIVSINPATFVEDYKASVFYGGEDTTELESSMGMVKELFSKVSGGMTFDAEKLSADMWAILRKPLANAAYETAESSDKSLSAYKVTIPGADAKAALVELLQYVYIDSEIGKFYSNLFPAELLGGEGQSFADLMQEQIITPFQEECPELPTVMVLSVDKDNALRALDITVTPAVAEGETAVVETITVNCEYKNDYDMTCKISMTAVENDVRSTIGCTVAGVYADGKYTTTCEIAADTDGSTVRMTMELLYGMDGALSMDVAVAVTAQDSEQMSFNIEMDGSITKAGDVTTYDFPTIAMTVSASGETYGASFALKSEHKPLSGALEKPETTEVLKMNEEELDALMTTYENGFQILLMQGMLKLGLITPDMIQGA